MDRSRFSTIVLGAGVSGLSTAFELTRRRSGDVLVLEREPEVGGQCRTRERDGARFDSGSHRIHDEPSKRAFALIQELCGARLIRNERGGKLRIRSGYIDYPITSFKMFLGLGVWESARCALSLLRGMVTARRGEASAEANYESYLVQRAGRRSYQIFYEPYARKVWACEPREISMTAVKKRISMTRPTQMLVDMWQHWRGRSPRQRYYYVEGGIGTIPLALAERVESQGGVIMRGVCPVRVYVMNPDGGARYRVTVATAQGERDFACDRIVSTIPIRELLALVGLEERLTCEARQLTWRGLRFVALHFRGEPLLLGETFYFPELRYPFGRVSVPKRYSPSMLRDADGVTTVLCEVPSGPGDGRWEQSDVELVEACQRGLVAAGFVRADHVRLRDRDFSFRLAETYPIYYLGWQKAFAEALGILAQEYTHVFTSGKQGLYLHCNLDHAMEIGLDLADHIANGGDAPGWHLRASDFHALRIRD